MESNKARKAAQGIRLMEWKEDIIQKVPSNSFLKN